MLYEGGKPRIILLCGAGSRKRRVAMHCHSLSQEWEMAKTDRLNSYLHVICDPRSALLLRFHSTPKIKLARISRTGHAPHSKIIQQSMFAEWMHFFRREACNWNSTMRNACDWSPASYSVSHLFCYLLASPSRSRQPRPLHRRGLIHESAQPKHFPRGKSNTTSPVAPDQEGA